MMAHAATAEEHGRWLSPTQSLTEMFAFVKDTLTDKLGCFYAELTKPCPETAAKKEYEEHAAHRLLKRVVHALESLRWRHNREDRLSGGARSYFSTILPRPIIRFLGYSQSVPTAGHDPKEGPV